MWNNACFGIFGFFYVFQYTKKPRRKYGGEKGCLLEISKRTLLREFYAVRTAVFLRRRNMPPTHIRASATLVPASGVGVAVEYTKS